jgi:hypothetical protein
MPETNGQQTNGGGRMPRGEPYTFDEFLAATEAVRERAEPILAREEGYAQDEWFTADARDAVNEHLLDRSGPFALTHTGAGIAIGLQMAEARRDG